TVSLYVPLLTWWLVLQPFAWNMHVAGVYFVGMAGAMLLILAESHRPGDPMAIPFRVYGVCLSIGVLIPLSFYGFYKEFRYQDPDRIPLIFAAVALMALLGLTL